MRGCGEFNLANVGLNMLALRKTMKMSQEVLAERLNLSRNAVGSIERGDTIPSLDTLMQICQVFHVAPNDLLSADIAASYSVDPEMVRLSHEMEGFDESQKARVYSIMGTVISGVRAESLAK